MPEDVEALRTKAEVSAHLARKLVDSWLPAEASTNDGASTAAKPKLGSLYKTPENKRARLADVQKSVAAKKKRQEEAQIAAEKALNDGESRAAAVASASATPKGSSKPRAQVVDVFASYLSKTKKKKAK